LPALFEASRGAFLANNAALIKSVRWLAALLDSHPEEDRIQVLEPLAPDADSFLIAGRIHARVAPPMKKRSGTRSDQAIAWYQDIVIASTVWARGFDLVTDDADFAALVPHFPGLSLISSVDVGL
jgi:predicted nucleic acid-binding protein